jgi:hypothetical protein
VGRGRGGEKFQEWKRMSSVAEGGSPIQGKEARSRRGPSADRKWDSLEESFRTGQIEAIIAVAGS